MKISKTPIVPDQSINIKNPATELEHVYLALLLWQDIWINKFIYKIESKYWINARHMIAACPLCMIYDCHRCILDDCNKFCSTYNEFYKYNNNGAAYKIYLACLKKYNELKSITN